MGLGSLGRDIADALRFFTRLRVGEPAPGAPLDVDRIAWAAPVAGLAVGLIGALALVRHRAARPAPAPSGRARNSCARRDDRSVARGRAR